MEQDKNKQTNPDELIHQYKDCIKDELDYQNETNNPIKNNLSSTQENEPYVVFDDSENPYSNNSNNFINCSDNEQEKLNDEIIYHENNVDNHDSENAQQLVDSIKEEVSEKKKNFESLSAKQKAKLEYKALSKEDKKELKKRARKVELLNKPHKGPKDVQMTGNHVIELYDVVKYYTNGYVVTKILKGINLSIEKGSFVIILGPSGSGKTTLMNILSGLDRASEGKVYVAGKDLINLNHKELTKFRKDNVGYVFQQYGLIPNLTVRENVEIGADLQEDKTKRLNIDEILDAVGMSAYANKFPHQLSGGQQQRVSIARAFAKNPAILFGDEPTGAIDEEMSKVVLKQFVAINKKYGTTVIMVTHNPIFQGLGDVVVKVKDGLVNQIIYNKNPKTVDELPWGME